MDRIACPRCGRLEATAGAQRAYEYKESGLSGLYLHGGVTKITCGCSPGAYFRIEKEGQLQQVIALSLLMKPVLLTGREMRYLRKTCRLTQDNLARLLSVRRATVAEREAAANKSIGLADDFLFRGTALIEFNNLLRVPGESHLAVCHLEQLIAFSNSFVDLLPEMAERLLHPRGKGARRRTASEKLNLSLVEGEVWEEETKKAA